MVCCCSCWVVVAAIVALIVWLVKTPPPHKVLGVYTQPTRTYYVKVAIFYALLTLRRWQAAREIQKSKEVKASIGYGKKSRSTIEDMECTQELSDHPKAIDAVYFSGADGAGHYVVMATARRPNGVVNGVLYLRIPGLGLFVLPRTPDTLLFGEGTTFGAEGLLIAPITPMKSWKLSYTGKMKMESDRSQSPKEYSVDLQLDWRSDREYFDFDTDMHPLAVARSMAKEEWSKDYFKALKTAHQTHYEQMGALAGTVDIDGTKHELKLRSMRDHSYGHKREWKLLHRYGIHMFHIEDGTSINVGIVSQPVTCSHLELGFLSKKDGSKVSVSSVNLDLHNYGENGTPPKDYSFSFVAGGSTYLVEVEIVERPEFFIGWEWETRICELMATFKVNGIRGYGIVEWCYRHHAGRPQECLETDPKWTKTLDKG